MSLELVQIDAAQQGWQERRLGRTILKTYRTTLDLDDLLPNEKQPSVRGDEKHSRENSLDIWLHNRWG